LARVVFAKRARADFDEIFAWIAERGGIEVARAYTGRIESFCLAMTPFPQRGTARDDLRPGLRTVGFERRATIAFTVEGEDVIILRILYAGRSLDLAFDESL
jgi:toxin ParE1/3/4